MSTNPNKNTMSIKSISITPNNDEDNNDKDIDIIDGGNDDEENLEESSEEETEEEEEEENEEEENEEENENENEEEENEEEEEEPEPEQEPEEELAEKDDDNENDDNDENDDYDLESAKDSTYKKTQKTCIHKKVVKSNESSDDEPMFDFDDEDIQIEDTNIVAPEQRITKPILTKYERVRLLSDRTTQLIRGAKPMIKNTGGLTYKKIAELELENNVMPLKIRRPLPDGKFEIWYTKELRH